VRERVGDGVMARSARRGRGFLRVRVLGDVGVAGGAAERRVRGGGERGGGNPFGVTREAVGLVRRGGADEQQRGERERASSAPPRGRSRRPGTLVVRAQRRGGLESLTRSGES
jgi:hypothetical protein